MKNDKEENGKEENGIKRLLQSTKDRLLLSSEVQITGNYYALIQGTKGILEYNEEMVRIKLLQQDVSFYGDNLAIKSLSQDAIELSGKITKVLFNADFL